MAFFEKNLDYLFTVSNLLIRLYLAELKRVYLIATEGLFFSVVFWLFFHRKQVIDKDVVLIKSE